MKNLLKSIFRIEESKQLIEASKFEVVQNPDVLIQQAIARDSGVETIGKLLELKREYEKQEAEKAFNRAFAQWQTLKPVLPKTKTVSFGNTSYKYCPLEKIQEIIKDPLEQCGLSYHWEGIIHSDGRDGQRCVIQHVLGHSKHNDLYGPADESGSKNAIQANSSRDSYLQRYSIKGALGLVESGQDDDGVATDEMPYLKLIEHNIAVRENMAIILATKEALAEKEYESAAKYLYEMGPEVADALRVAATKGGIFTTEEVAQTKKNEFVAARNVYFKNKGE